MSEQSAGTSHRVRRFLVAGDGVYDRHWHALPPTTAPLSFTPHTSTSVDIGHSPVAGIKPTVRIFTEHAKAIFPITVTDSHSAPASNSRQTNPSPLTTTKPEPVPAAAYSSPSPNKALLTPPAARARPVSAPQAPTPAAAPHPPNVPSAKPVSASTSAATNAPGTGNDVPMRQQAVALNATTVRSRKLSGSGQIAPPTNRVVSASADHSQPHPSSGSPRASLASAASAAAAAKRLSTVSATKSNEQRDALNMILAGHSRRRAATSGHIAPIASLPPLPTRRKAEQGSSGREQNVISIAEASGASNPQPTSSPTATKRVDRDPTSTASAPKSGVTTQHAETAVDDAITPSVPASATDPEVAANNSAPSSGPGMKEQHGYSGSTDTGQAPGDRPREEYLPVPTAQGTTASPNTLGITGDSSKSKSVEQDRKNMEDGRAAPTPVQTVQSGEATRPAVPLGNDPGSSTTSMVREEVAQNSDARVISRQGSAAQGQERTSGRAVVRHENMDVPETSLNLDNGKEASSKRAVEKDVPLNKSTGKVSDPRSPQASKSAVKLIKVHMDGVKRPGASKSSAPRSGALPEQAEEGDGGEMMEIEQAEARPARTTAETSNDMNRGTAPTKTNASQSKTAAASQSSPTTTKSIPDAVKRNPVSGGVDNGPSGSTNAVETPAVAQEHDKYLGCVKVLARMLRKHSKNHDRMKDNGRKISILESRNNLLKAVVDKLQNMDTSLNNGTAGYPTEKSAHGNVPRASNVNDESVADRRTRTAVPSQRGGSNVNTEHPPQAAVKNPSRPASAPGRSASEQSPGLALIERDNNKRKLIVQETRLGVRELRAHFQKFAQLPSNISLGQLRQVLGKFSRNTLREMQKLGGDNPEYLSKELASFLESVEPASTVVVFLWDNLKLLFADFKNAKKFNNTNDELNYLNQMKTFFVCLRDLVALTSLLGAWVTVRWTILSEKKSDKNLEEKIKEEIKQYQTRLSNFYLPIGASKSQLSTRYLGRLGEVLRGLESRREDEVLPLRDERQKLARDLKECLDNLRNTCMEAWMFESNSRSEGAVEHAPPIHTANPANPGALRSNDDGRGASMKRKAGEAGQTDNQEQGDQPHKRRALAGPSTGSRAEVSGATPHAGTARVGDERTKDMSGSNPSRFFRPSRPVPNSSASNRVSGAMQPGQSSGVTVGNASNSGSAAKGQEGKPKKSVRFNNELVTGRSESKLQLQDVQSLFNDGYDLLGGNESQSEVQRQAVEERASQLQRGSVIALYGYLRSYVEMLTKEVEGEPAVNPEWITLPYTPSAVRRMVRDRTNNNQ